MANCKATFPPFARPINAATADNQWSALIAPTAASLTLNDARCKHAKTLLMLLKKRTGRENHELRAPLISGRLGQIAGYATKTLRKIANRTIIVGGTTLAEDSDFFWEHPSIRSYRRGALYWAIRTLLKGVWFKTRAYWYIIYLYI